MTQHGHTSENCVAIFTSRESLDQITRTIKCCRDAFHGQPFICDLIVNGNMPLVNGVCEQVNHSQMPKTSLEGMHFRLWSIDSADKANAWNQYIHTIWPEARTTFFIDGYAEVKKDSFSLLSNALWNSSEAHAASGVPHVGASAKSQAEFQLRISGIHGSLYALKQHSVEMLRTTKFCLPIGIYATDSTMESFLKFNFAPGEHNFNHKRVVVVPNAHWNRRVLSPWKLKDLNTHFSRVVRQRLRDFVELAVKHRFRGQDVKDRRLPETNRELILSWSRANPILFASMIVANPLRLWAFLKVLSTIKVPAQPQLIAEKEFLH